MLRETVALSVQAVLFSVPDPSIAGLSLHPPHLTDSKGLPALIPFCAYRGNMRIMGEHINGLDFPVCNAFKPKIIDGELCYARGGTDLPKNDKIFRKLKLTGIFRCSFMFKNRGKFWFLSKSSFDPPYMGSENFDHFR